MVIFFQVGLPVLTLIISVPGLEQGYGDKMRYGVTIFVAMLAIALSVLLGLLVGPGRPVAWLGAVLLQVAFAAAYCLLIYWAWTAPSPEGMLAAFGLLIGAPLVLMSLIGLVLLLVPATTRYCLRRP